MSTTNYHLLKFFVNFIYAGITTKSIEELIERFSLWSRVIIDPDLFTCIFVKIFAIDVNTVIVKIVQIYVFFMS